MKKKLALLLAGIVVVLLVKGIFYYGGFYSPSARETPDYGALVPAEPPLTKFSDVVSGEHKGTILIDTAHKNSFVPEELSVLLSRLISRGLTVRFTTAQDSLSKELLGKDNGGKTPVAVKPSSGEKEEPPPLAFIVISPDSEFTRDEKKTVREFLDKGGKLLLISDPTRPSKINSLALDCELIFEDDYLYNMQENELNYRNIFVKDFKSNVVTKDLKKIALYTAGSITSNTGGIAFTDENTFSSRIETRKNLSPMALTDKPAVLAVYDLTFMTEPHNGIADNNQLITNIAIWLSSSTTSKVDEKKPEEASELPSPP